MALYDTGIGGLALLRECLTACPDAQWLYVADDDLFPAGDRPRAELRDRLHQVRRLLDEMEVDVVLPAAAVAWLDPLALVPPGALLVDPAATLAAALSGLPDRTAVLTLPVVADHGLVDKCITAGAPAVIIADSGVAPLVERGLNRDSLLMNQVRMLSGRLQGQEASRLLLANSHAWLINDLFGRGFGSLGAVVDVPRILADGLSQATGSRSAPRVLPDVTLVTTRRNGSSLAALAARYLQIPDPPVEVAHLEAVSPPSTSERDLALLAYAAFDAGRIDELRQIVAPRARYLPSGRLLVEWAESLRRSVSAVSTQVDAVLQSGHLIGVAGTCYLGSAGGHRFAHRLHIEANVIVSLDAERR